MHAVRAVPHGLIPYHLHGMVLITWPMQEACLRMRLQGLPKYRSVGIWMCTVAASSIGVRGAAFQVLQSAQAMSRGFTMGCLQCAQQLRLQGRGTFIIAPEHPNCSYSFLHR